MKVNEHVGAQGQNSMPATTNVERKNEDLEDDVPVQREHFQICFCFSSGPKSTEKIHKK